MALGCSVDYLDEKIRKLCKRSYNAKKFVESVQDDRQPRIESIHKLASIYEELLEAEVQLKSAIQHVEENLDQEIIDKYPRGE